MRKLFTIAIAILFTSTMFGQTVVTGNVKDASSGEPLPGVNIKVVGKSLGTATDFDGNYTLKVNQEPPFDIVITILGYGSQTLNVTEKNQTLDVSLTENASALDEVVISASRTPESVRESPVTIERMDARDIANASSASFYNSIENLKGVDVNTSSLTFNSVNTRGFASFANTRFLQLVDGMDNSSPVLNFVIGNLLGMNELDAQSVELLPGASSALYGANAFNGVLFMTSKNPFDHQGISLYLKKGITDSDAGGENAYSDFGIRAAHAFSEKFAAKVSFSYLKGTDWIAVDDNQYDAVGAGLPDAITAAGGRAHNGLNLYGDEFTANQVLGGANLDQVAASLGFPLIDSGTGLPILDGSGIGDISITPYSESTFTDHTARSVKTDVSLNFKPMGNDLEIIWNSRIGFGNTIYQGTSRFQLEDFLMQQHKLEIRNDDFFVRGYVTSETAGKSFNINNTGFLLAGSIAQSYFGTYAAVFAQNFNLNGNNRDLAHAAARTFVDDPANGIRPGEGTPELDAIINGVNGVGGIKNDPDVNTGSLFLDNTKSYNADGNYNFKSLLNDFMDLQVGGNYKQYSLDSGGTIFTDADGPIEYDEYGAYIQGIKKFMDDRLKITASIRVDENEFFDANISPRISFNYGAGDSKQHNFRASFQTGFRNPDTQSLFIGLNLAAQGIILAGGSPANLDRELPGTTIIARDVYENTNNNVFSLAALQAGIVPGTPGNLPIATELPHEEQVTSFEVGYRGKLSKITVDLNAYFNDYESFLSATRVGIITAAGLQPFQIFTNSDADITTFGAAIGLSTRVGKGYKIGLNYTFADIDFDQASDPDFQSGFNTPEHKVKFNIGNSNVFKNIGFNINARWSDSYLWEATYASGNISARTNVDAQINYSIPKWKNTTFKIGGSNLGGDDYTSAIGSGSVGQQYYIGLTINN